eukprot:1978206-Rhodomonas_salina.4
MSGADRRAGRYTSCPRLRRRLGHLNDPSRTSAVRHTSSVAAESRRVCHCNTDANATAKHARE